MTVGIPEYMPFSGLRDGKPVGLIARAALRALSRIGIKTTLRDVPFSRMYRWIHSGRLDIAVSVLKSPERAAQAHYSAPIAAEYTVILVANGKRFPFRRAEDLRNRRIGAQLGFLYPGIDHVNLPLVRERDFRASIAKVVEGKVDGALIGSVTGLYAAADMGVLDQLDTLPNASEVIPLGVAFSAQAFSPEDVAAFENAILDIKGEPVWQRILEQSGAARFIRDWPVIRRR